MANKTVLDFPAITEINDDDVLYVIRGTGTDRDKKGLISAIRKSGLFRNLILNPDGAVAQRGISFTSATTPKNNDDTYLLDRWNLLSDGNNRADIEQIVISDLFGSQFAIRSTAGGTAFKYGFLQIIENKNTIPVVNGKISLSFQIKEPSLGTNMRVAVLGWTGTADIVTSDVVSYWEVAGDNPSLVANWEYIYESLDTLPVTTSWSKIKVENISVGNYKNIAIFIWVDSISSGSGIVDIAQVVLNEGAQCVPYQPRRYEDELRLCQRYCWRVNGNTTDNTPLGSGMAISYHGYCLITLPIVMRKFPLLIVSAANDFLLRGVIILRVSTAISIFNDSPAQVRIIELDVTVLDGIADGDVTLLYLENETSAFIEFDAEL